MNTDKNIEEKSKLYYDRMFEDNPILLNFSIDYEDGLRQGFVHGFKAAMHSGPFEIFPETEGSDWFSCLKLHWNSIIKQRDDAVEELESIRKQITNQGV